MPYIIYKIHLFNIFHRIFCSYFTLFIANIVTLCTFFHRIYAVFTHFSIEFMQNDVQGYDTLFDIRYTKPHPVAPTSYTLSHFVAFIFYTFLT